MIPAANAMWSQTGPVAIRDGTNKEPGGRTDMWTVLAQGGLVKRWQIQLCTIQSEIEQLHTYVKIMVLKFLLLTICIILNASYSNTRKPLKCESIIKRFLQIRMQNMWL